MFSKTPRRAAVAVASVTLILGLFALAGCSSGSGNSAVVAPDMADSGGSPMAQSEAASEDAGRADGAESASSPAAPSAEYPSGSGDAASSPIVSGRQIIRTANVTVQVTVEPEEGEKEATPAALAAAANRAAHQVRAMASLPDAYVSGSDGHGATITVTLRIPAGQYDSVMGRLADIGDVIQQSESTQDVTGEMVDVASRLQSMQASVDRLRALMADANSMKDIISIESELTSRQADLESLQRRQAELSDQVALSTISVTIDAITEPVQALNTEPGAERSAFMKGLDAGWRGVTAVGRAAAAVIGAFLPFLIPLAVVAAVGWYGIWLFRRRRSSLPAVAAGHPLDVGSDVDKVNHDADQGDQPQQ